eukprot:COSAG02_NODE_46_length_45443_cov_36.731497_20_plen_95_part_00
MRNATNGDFAARRVCLYHVHGHRYLWLLCLRRAGTNEGIVIIDRRSSDCPSIAIWRAAHEAQSGTQGVPRRVQSVRLPLFSSCCKDAWFANIMD